MTTGINKKGLPLGSPLIIRAIDGARRIAETGLNPNK